MRPEQTKEIKHLAKGRVHFDYPLGQKGTFKAGGKVEALCEVDSMDSLRNLVEFSQGQSISCLVLGGASNVLVKDEGLDAVVLFLTGEFENIQRVDEPPAGLWVGAGVSLFDLLLTCRNMGLGGLEFLAGIPGKVGGAVRGNAGAFGGQIGENIVAVEFVTETGDLVVMDREGLEFGYRSLNIPDGAIITRALLAVNEDDSEKVRERIVQYLIEKKDRQPLDLPSLGSVFKNPPGDYAGRMIEAVGLKGTSIGGAMISPKHANFIVNTGRAKAADFLALVKLAKEKVKEEFGITLELEIKVLG